LCSMANRHIKRSSLTINNNPIGLSTTGRLVDLQLRRRNYH
jgi:hypothetical protein